MKNTLHLTISSVAKQYFAGDVTMAIFPGSEGEMTVLANHEPLVTTLQTGEIIIRREGEEDHVIAVDGGVLEIANSRATVLL